MKLFKTVLPVTLLIIVLFKPAYALGPVDGDVGVGFWNNDASDSSSLDIGSTVVHGELWLFNKWGVRAAQYDSDLEGTDFSNDSRTQLDVRRRFFSVGDNNFFAIGLGLEEIDLKNGESTDGLRLSAEAKLGLVGPINFYGRISTTPSMGSTSSLKDISANELETGVNFTPFPFLTLKLAYLKHSLDYDLVGTGGRSTDSSGYILGAGFHW